MAVLAFAPKNPANIWAPEMLERNNVKRKHFGIRLRPLPRVIREEMLSVITKLFENPIFFKTL